MRRKRSKLQVFLHVNIKKVQFINVGNSNYLKSFADNAASLGKLETFKGVQRKLESFKEIHSRAEM